VEDDVDEVAGLGIGDVAPAAAEARPAEASPTEASPAEASPAEASPAEARPSEARPAEHSAARSGTLENLKHFLMRIL
jgi:hypothetical protein